MNETKEHLFEQAKRKIDEAQNILLVTHHNPDGDCLSSLCSIAEYLNGIKKSYFAFCYDQPPKQFNFLPNIEKINYIIPSKEAEIIFRKNEKLEFEKYDLILVFDCGSLSRTKLAKELIERRSDQFVIEFDHHPKTDEYSNLEIRDEKAAATAEIIYNFFKANHLLITKPIANALLTGLITDTASFFYPSTSGQTIKAASELVLRGGQLPQITEQTLRNKSLESMKIWGKIMSNLEINKKYNLAFTIVPHEDFLNNQIDKEELEGIAGFLSNLHGVNGILFLREEIAGTIHGSLRTSKPEIDISKLAKLLGGGGHPKASGFSIPGKIIKTEKGFRII